MADSLTPEERSAHMAKVRSGDTKPEWILRTGLHRMGFRYSLRSKGLPGRPDLVFPRYGAVVFVHGCYWHFHRKGKCRRSSVPKSNVEFWQEKFERNRNRDRANVRALRKQGWRVITVWECELLDKTVATVEKVAVFLREEDGGKSTGFRYPVETETDRRRKLIRVAESKVRKRIDGYG